MYPKLRFKGFDDAWEQRKLGELVNFLDTQRKPLEESKRKKGPYPYYGASGIVDYVSDYIFDRELILLSEDGANITDRNYPVCFLASGKYWVNNHAHVLECKAENDNNFICISLERKDFKKFNTGMAMPKLNKETCKIIPVSCTSLEEQTKIGNFFRELETNITLHQRQCEALKKQKQFFLQNMFPKEGESEPRIRFNGFTEPWEQRKLGDIGTTYTGLSGKSKNDFGHGEAKYIPYINIFNNPKVDISRLDSIEIDKKQNCVKRGDVLFTTSSETPEEVGMSSVVCEDIENTYLNSFCFGFRPVKVFDLDFLAFLFRSDFFRKQIVLLAQGISRYNISKTKAMNIDLLIPNMEEQIKIGSLFANIEETITLHQRQYEQLVSLKKYLLSKMFI